MTRPVELMGLGPRREVIKLGDGSYEVRVTPPKFMGDLPTVAVRLNSDQYRRYRRWRDFSELIQDALFDLSADQREALMTGLGPEDFSKAASEEE